MTKKKMNSMMYNFHQVMKETMMRKAVKRRKKMVLKIVKEKNKIRYSKIKSLRVRSNLKKRNKKKLLSLQKRKA
jgi:hypothetical protein